jgi:predicted nucleic acid-binding protein
MSVDFFLDSNVILYALSSSEQDKQSIATSIVSSALAEGNAVISTQVVHECLNVATGKLESRVPGSARQFLGEYLMPLCRVFPSEGLFVRALEIKEAISISFCDACIVAAAIESGARTLLTEDLQHGQTIHGLLIHNPFRESVPKLPPAP